MKKIYFLFSLLTVTFTFAQTTYNGNGNTGFGDVIGNSTLQINDDGTTITFTVTKGPGNWNDALVLYFDTGATGRTAIDSDVEDNADGLRTAISNGNSGGFGSEVRFPLGFEASHAIAVNTSFGGLWSIPATGIIANNDLNFITSVNSNLASTTQATATFDVDWSELGYGSAGSFEFVGLYLSTTAFNSDEGYGSGIPSGSTGAVNIAYTASELYSSSTLSAQSYILTNANVAIVNNSIRISGVQGEGRIEVYSLLGKRVFDSGEISLKGNDQLTASLPSNNIYIVRLTNGNSKKAFKVIAQ